MSNQPKYIEFSYSDSYTLDLDKLEIDLTAVKHWYIKWHTLYVTFVDESEEEFLLNIYGCSTDSEFHDFKRPSEALVYDREFMPSRLGNNYDNP